MKCARRGAWFGDGEAIGALMTLDLISSLETLLWSIVSLEIRRVKRER